MKSDHTFTDPETGETTPMRDADVDYQVQVFKAHNKKAIPQSPTHCVAAKGAVCSKDVYKAYVGSGNEVYLTFYGKGRLGKHTLRYIARTNLKRVRDLFDQRGSPKTQWVTLGAPTASNSLEAKARRLEKDRKEREERKERELAERRTSGHSTSEELERVEFLARRGGQKKKRRSRVERLGVQQRPRAIVNKDGSWMVPEPEPEAVDA